MSNTSWPEDVGIKAIEFVFPKQYVDQADLEQFDGVSAGKYTIGLGQKQMGFCSDLEDINSLCLTVLSQLIEKNALKYEDIGRIDVGTETIIDKSKSVKTVLMDLFTESGNFNVEGLDTTNACYGGTAALFNSLAWVESSAWDGRLAVVVAADIAIYAKGNARPTGGAGAVALLIGPNAPIVVERGLRSTFMKNVYDFYKPDLTSEYPVVDAQLSIKCYLSALDHCYKGYRERTKDPDFTLDKLDAMIFHSPYCKLVQKALARLVVNDFVLTNDKSKYFPGLDYPQEIKLEESYFDRNVEKVFMEYSKPRFEKMTSKSLVIASRIGNMYTASVYGGLTSYLVNTALSELPGKRIGVFSYGSGLASSMYSLRIKGGPHLDSLIQNISCIMEKLDSRTRVPPPQFCEILDQRAANLHRVPCVPQSTTEYLFPGTWYVKEIDDKFRRVYTRKL